MRLVRRPLRGDGDDDRILPMINVVFLLLIFFMVVGSLSAADPFRIEPPASDNGAAGEPGGLVLLIGADGRIALDGTEIDRAGLLAAVSERLAAAPGSQLYVKADGSAEAGAVVGVLEALRRAGAERVRLMAVPQG